MPMDENKKKKSFFKSLLKRIKLTHILFLIVLLAVNSYAWFIYINTVSNSVDVHVKAWRIDFLDGETPVTDYVEIDIDSIYPGMATYEKPIDAHNYSDIGATVTYQIMSATIMGTEIITVEGKEDRGLTLNGTEMTSAELEEQLAEDYPFTITFDISTDSMQAEVGVSTYTITVDWPYESGDDELDTEWGKDAYDYKQAHPGYPCINIQIKIIITQAES